jgi:hypothetical protein
MAGNDRGGLSGGGVRMLVAAAALFVLAVAAAKAQGLDPSRVTRDLAGLCQAHLLDGVLSSLGVLMWIATAAICIGSGMLTWHILRRGAGFLIAAGSLSLWLGLDDLFQFHELIASTQFGLHELAVYQAIGTTMLLFLWCFRQPILDGAPGWLLGALCLLAASVALDTVVGPWIKPLGPWAVLAEDGFKWLGIVCWLRYFAAQAAGVLAAAGLGRVQRQPSIWGPVAPRDGGVTA